MTTAVLVVKFSITLWFFVLVYMLWLPGGLRVCNRAWLGEDRELFATEFLHTLWIFKTILKVVVQGVLLHILGTIIYGMLYDGRENSEGSVARAQYFPALTSSRNQVAKVETRIHRANPQEAAPAVRQL